MTVQIKERITSRPLSIGKSSKFERSFVITGTDDEQVAVAAVIATCAASIMHAGRLFIRESASVDPIGDPLESKMWYGEASYGPPSSAEQTEEEARYTFNTVGGTERVKVAKEHIEDYNLEDPYEDAPNFEGAINVTGDGPDMRVDGVDIPSPVFEFTLTKAFPESFVDNTYKGKIFNLTGKVNSGWFMGLKRGECLFLGAATTTVRDGLHEISFRFAGSPNKTNITLGNNNNIEKEGWYYLWVRFGKKLDQAVQKLLEYPTSAHVERVFDYGDFEDLAIDGTS
jgi:hypothetical protein